MGRKLMISSVLVFVYPGSPTQLAAGFLITFLSLLVTVRKGPYSDQRLEDMQIYALFALTTTIFYGIMLLVSSLRTPSAEPTTMTTVAEVRPPKPETLQPSARARPACLGA
eukprot:3463898-Rhodomonas_salina.3